MIKVVLFDLDGTLLHRHESLIRFIDDQFERYYEYFSHITKEVYTSRFIDLDKRGYVWKDKVYNQLIEEFNISGLTYDALVEDYLLYFNRFCIPFPNMIQMLENLKKQSFQLGLITNGRGQFQMNNIKALGIESYFSCILISEIEGISKPDPEIFKRAINFFNILPEEAVYIGDHPENDYLGAKNVGMKVIWKQDHFWEEFETENMIDDLIEIPILIKKIN